MIADIEDQVAAYAGWLEDRTGVALAPSPAEDRGTVEQPGTAWPGARRRRSHGRTVARLAAVAAVAAGVVGVALKRGSLFGRAPVIHDLTLAYTIFGFLDESPDPALVDLRRELFASAAHHYAERRAIVDLVPEATLRLTPTQAAEAYAGGWRGPLGLND